MGLWYRLGTPVLPNKGSLFDFKLTNVDYMVLKVFQFGRPHFSILNTLYFYVEIFHFRPFHQLQLTAIYLLHHAHEKLCPL